MSPVNADSGRDRGDRAVLLGLGVVGADADRAHLVGSGLPLERALDRSGVTDTVSAVAAAFDGVGERAGLLLGLGLELSPKWSTSTPFDGGDHVTALQSGALRRVRRRCRRARVFVRSLRCATQPMRAERGRRWLLELRQPPADGQDRPAG